jgi:putative ABC transport system ATP-binding protein
MKKRMLPENDLFFLPTTSVDLTINAGQLMALKGRSGSGKTTFLNIIGGLDTPTNGKVS